MSFYLSLIYRKNYAIYLVVKKKRIKTKDWSNLGHVKLTNLKNFNRST